MDSQIESDKRQYSRMHLNYTLGLLFVINVTSYMDRMVLAVLLEPIRIELGLSDTQIGLLTGFAFASLYVLVGFPIARLADRGHRKQIMAVSLLIWSGMTVLSGRAQNFAQLFLARMAVGFGEAGCFPTATALITELFPPHRRSMAMGVFMSGATVGMILGFGVGGWLGETYGWRMTFVIVGLPGLLLSVVVMLTLNDRSVIASAEKPKEPYWTLVKTILSSPLYRRVLAGASLGSFAIYGMTQWAPAFFIRVHAMPLSEVGVLFGVLYGGGAAIGLVVGGWVADKLMTQDSKWIVRMPGLVYLISFPLLVLVFAVESTNLAFLLVFLGALFASSAGGPTLAAIQLTTPPDGRATSAAIFMLFTSLVGVGAAPFFVGLISDLLQDRAGVNSLRYALMITTTVVLSAGLCFLSAVRYIEVPENLELSDGSSVI